MIDIKMTIDGREVSPNQFADEMLKAVKDDIDEQVRSRISQARCPVHGNSPTNIRTQMDGDKATWTFDACCGELEKAAGAALD